MTGRVDVGRGKSVQLLNSVGHAGADRREGPDCRGSGNRWLALVVLVCLALVAGACAIRPLPPLQKPPELNPGDPGSGEPQEERPPCTLAAVRSCGLPYPTDDFEVPNPNSPTGVGIEIPDGVIPEHILDSLGPGADIKSAFDGADGFSALSPILFEFDVPVDAGYLPEDGGDKVQVFDLTTGDRLEIRVSLSVEALRHGAPETILMIQPVTRWPYGHQVVAAVAQLRGIAADPSPASAIETGHLDPVFADLASVGVGDGSGEGLLSATRFTVGTRENATRYLTTMADVARNEPHPVRRIKVHPPLFHQNASAFVQGEVSISDFRDESGVIRLDQPPKPSWIPFLLVIPKKPASERGAPVAVYGHGLTINKETNTVVANANAKKGIATIAIDVPNHGARQAGQGGYLLDLANPKGLGRLLNMFPQGIVDHVSLVEAVEEELTDLDAAPWNPFGRSGDGVADLDTSSIFYQGTSMGGVLGAAEVALIPEIDAAFLQVPGSGVADIIFHSLLWAVFSGVVPWNATAGDAAALMGAVTMLVDRGENAHLMEELGASGRAVFLQVGVGDLVVSNAATTRMARLLGFTNMEPSYGAVDVPSSGSTEFPADGRGVKAIWPSTASPEGQGFLAHVSFTEPKAMRLMDDWLDNRLAAMGLVP